MCAGSLACVAGRMYSMTILARCNPIAAMLDDTKQDLVPALLNHARSELGCSDAGVLPLLPRRLQLPAARHE